MAGLRSLLGFGLLSFLAAAVGGMFQPGEWFAGLEKPWWNPPGWVFGPVWTLLYLLIAVAGWRVWRSQPGARRRLLLGLWGGQMLLNALWSWLFFGLQRPGLALVDIAALLVLITAFAGFAWRHDRLASGLFVPYLAWVGFATALNAAIWALNR